ncbi:MAG: hypothetical protein ACI4F3_11335 [Enterocloster sp.]
MKVQELRQLLSTADRALLEKAFVESYKHFSKNQKEEVDLVINGVLEGKEGTKKEKRVMEFGDLEQQITEFLWNARAQNYMAPNRVIPKSQRPKWRFLVKNFIKELEQIPVESEHYSGSVKLLTDLYLLMCEACNYYLFSTDDPFRSIGWQQPDLFSAVVKRTFALGYTRENISALLLYAATGGLSRESLHTQMELVLISELKNSDVRHTAMEEAKKLIEVKKGQLMKLKTYDSRYECEEDINELCDTILLLSLPLAETEAVIPYYFLNSREHEQEIVLYRALKLMEWMDEDELWIKIYQYGLKIKIHPRDSLVKAYEGRKNAADK